MKKNVGAMKIVNNLFSRKTLSEEVPRLCIASFMVASTKLGDVTSKHILFGEERV